MRVFWLRCFVLLLALALVSGNAHAELHLGNAQHHPCPETLDHPRTNAPHHHQKAADLACCCDCLGCVSAVSLTPDLTSFVPAFLAGAVRYSDETAALAGRALRPEPGPPRPGALI